MGKKFHQHKSKVSAQPKQETKAAPVAEKKESKPTDPRVKYGVMAGVGVLFLWLASVAPAAFFITFHRICFSLCGGLLRGLEC